VSIADPVWASLLRRAGVFSGKRVRPELAGDAAHGLAAGVVISDLPAMDPPAAPPQRRPEVSGRVGCPSSDGEPGGPGGC